MRELLKPHPIIPLVTVENLDDALPLAKALQEGGISVIEIALRSEAGLKAIETISHKMPNMLVAAGTVINVKLLKQAKEAGAKWIISPGLTHPLAEAAKESELPFLPGVVTASGIMHALEFGFDTVKFFPAVASGGLIALNALAAAFPEVKFCPTGGISEKNMANYLSLDHVISVGGSWLTPKEKIQEKDWNTITEIAKTSMNV